MEGKCNGNTLLRTKENAKFLTVKEKQVYVFFEVDCGYQIALLFKFGWIHFKE